MAVAITYVLIVVVSLILPLDRPTSLKNKHTTKSGDGKVTCPTCTGTGQLRHFIEMTRTHKTIEHTKAGTQNVDNIHS